MARLHRAPLLPLAHRDVIPTTKLLERCLELMYATLIRASER